MKQVSIHEVAPGMILAKNVYGRNDNLLLGKGAMINDDNLAQLLRFGVQILWVEAPEDEVLQHQDLTTITREVEEMLNSQFERVSHNPIMNDLKRLFTHCLIKKKSR
jgi:hypothetical protein